MRNSCLKLSAVTAIALLGLTACNNGDSDVDIAGGDADVAGVDAVYSNGTILTVNADNDVAEAVAVDDGMIVAVGSESEIKDLAGDKTEDIDLHGRTMIPGIYDAHSHFSAMGTSALDVDLNSPPIGEVENMDELIAKLSERAKSTPKGEWIQGSGYDDTLLEKNRHPTREDLDKVSTQHPIYITHISGHLGVANSLALEKAGITADTPNPEGGVIRKNKAGEPNGVLEESAATSMVSSQIPPATDKEIKEAIRYAGKFYASQGVTTANEGAASAKNVALMKEVESESGLPIRVMIWPMLETVDAIDDMDLPSDKLIVGGVKDFADGSIQGYTGYLSEPYYVAPEGKPDDYRGFPHYDREVLAKRIKKVHDSGRQVIVHGNGDAAIDDILYGIRKAQEANPREDTRPVIIHAQMAREDQLDEMKELGVIPSFYVLHTYYWGDRHRDIFMGPDRAARMSPTKSAESRGIRYTIHTDTPVVPMDPMRLIWSAVNRISKSGEVIGPNQTVSPTQALRATTIDAAYENFEEDMKGSIEEGKLADLVILSDNPLEVTHTHIKDIEVEETIVGGQTVYERNG